jgi:hypothetical protein
MKIADIQGLPDGANIASIAGTLTAVYPPKTGQSARGPYSFQDLVLQDETGEIKVSVQQPGEPAVGVNLKGRHVTISSKSGPKGLSGVYAEDHTYNNATTRRIKVTPTGTIAIVDAKSTATHEKPNLLVIGSKFVAGYLFALDRADEIGEARAQIGRPLTPEQFQSLTATAFISMEKRGLYDAVSIQTATPAAAPEDDEIPF